MHHVCYPAYELFLALTHPSYTGPSGLKVRMKETVTPRRRVCLQRLFRTQLYCLVATCLGGYLLYTQYRHWPSDLLHQWGPWQEIGFEMAIAHWILAIIEDTNSGVEVIGHMKVSEEDEPAKYVEYFNGLLMHHMLTIAAYSWCLWTHYLSGLCVFGLLFELPVVFLNARDIFAMLSNWGVFHDSPQPIPDKLFYIIWVPILLTWHSTRTLFCLLWPLSLIIWRPELNTVPLLSRLVYHFLGIMFNIVNVKLTTGVVPQCAIDDLRRTVSKMAIAAEGEARDRAAGISVDKKWPLGSRHPPSEDSKQAQSLIGYEQLSKHSSREDLWVVIQGKVYDLTEFAQRHPGGAEVLVKVAGKDASAEFLEAGHSNKARGMMKKFVVAHLTPHGYDQKDEMLTHDFRAGDISKAYEFGKKYTGYDHPLFLFLVVSAASIYLLTEALSDHPVYLIADGPISDDRVDVGLVGAVASLLVHAALCCTCLLLVCMVFLCSYLERWVGFSHANSTNPFLSLLMYCCSSVSLMNGALLIIWLLCDLCLLSNTFVGGYGMSGAMTGYRISCMISLCAELLIKVKFDPPHEHRGYIHVAATILSVATALDLLCYCVELQANAKVVLLPHLLGVIVLAVIAKGLYVRFIHHFSVLGTRRDPDFNGPGTGCSHYLHTLASILIGAILSFLFAVLIGHFFMEGSVDTTLTYSMSGMWYSVWEYGDSQWSLAACMFGLGLMMLGSLIRESNAVFTSQARAIGIILLTWAVGPSFGYAEYVVWLATIGGLLVLSKETAHTLESKGAAAPRYLYTAKQIEYFWRRTAAMLIHYLVGIPLMNLLHFISPEYDTYFYAGPVLDMGEAVEVGVAYQYSAKNQGEPKNFQCNVGYMKNIEELVCTGNSTKKILQELMNDPEAGEKGFVSDIVAHFHLNPKSFAALNGYTVREVNLSAWTSEQAAYQWYKNSAAHKEIVKLHYGGGLENFTPLLASLKPSEDRPIRYEVRCEKCRKVVKGPNCDVCPFCEATMSHMPYF